MPGRARAETIWRTSLTSSFASRSFASPASAPIASAHSFCATEIVRRASQLDVAPALPRVDRGGDFAALEAPDLLVEDVRAFFRRCR
jgi:hypothetical protein